MKVRFSYRCYPTEQQKKALSRLFGCVRVVWNDALARCKRSEIVPSNGDLQKICITEAKKTFVRRWLDEVSVVPLQQSIRNLGVAFKNYFDSRGGKRRGPKIGPPQFKRKQQRQSACFTLSGFSLKGGKVYLAKIGRLKLVWSRPLPSEPTSVTITKDSADRYFVSFVVVTQPEIITANNESIGMI